MANPRIESRSEGNLIKVVAIFNKPGMEQKIGHAQGVIEGDGIGLLGDILVQERIFVPGRLFGLKKIPYFPRRQGVGAELLARFESEMASLGVTRIYGHLPNENPEVIECLVNWYQKRGYQVNLDPAPGEIPRGSRGKISKLIDQPHHHGIPQTEKL